MESIHMQCPTPTSSIVDRKLKTPENLPCLIAELHRIFADDVINVEQVKDLLASFTCSSKEWRKFAKWDPHRYTRNLVDEGNGKFNLMILCWNEGQGSSIHSHADSHCFLKVLQGTAQEELYDWPEEENGVMNTRDVSVYTCGQVQYINDSLGLHRVENPSHSDALVTLHLYSPPFSECKTFDKRTGQPRSSSVTFWSKHGKRTPWSKVESALYEHTLPKK